MKPRHLAFVLLLGVLLSSSAYPHGGGLDALGCHHNRKAGGYHCHRGPLAGRSFASKADAQRALQASEKRQNAQQSPPAQTQSQNDDEKRTVYVTKSGKKYHGEACSYLKSSKIPMSLKEAKRKGYTACSRCGGK